MAVEIRQIDGRKELKKFVEFNLELYKNNPYHVPGIIKDEIDLLDKDKNPSFDVCEAAYFLAYKDGKIVSSTIRQTRRGIKTTLALVSLTSSMMTRWSTSSLRL